MCRPTRHNRRTKPTFPCLRSLLGGGAAAEAQPRALRDAELTILRKLDEAHCSVLVSVRAMMPGNELRNCCPNILPEVIVNSQSYIRRVAATQVAAPRCGNRMSAIA